MSHLIIGLTGKKRAGKSTVAKHLCEKHGFVEITVAEPLKEVIGRHLFYFTDEQLYGNTKDVVDERWFVTPREVWLAFGEFIRGKYGEDYLAKRTMFRIAALFARYPKGARVVVSDCKFPRELEVVETVGGVTCRVTKEGNTTDESDIETATDSYNTDFEFSAADGDLDSLLAQTDKMMEKISAI